MTIKISIQTQKDLECVIPFVTILYKIVYLIHEGFKQHNYKKKLQFSDSLCLYNHIHNFLKQNVTLILSVSLNNIKICL